MRVHYLQGEASQPQADKLSFFNFKRVKSSEALRSLGEGG
jgi:hypothetical protein